MYRLIGAVVHTVTCGSADGCSRPKIVNGVLLKTKRLFEFEARQRACSTWSVQSFLISRCQKTHTYTYIHIHAYTLSYIHIQHDICMIHAHRHRYSTVCVCMCMYLHVMPCMTFMRCLSYIFLNFEIVCIASLAQWYILSHMGLQTGVRDLKSSNVFC